MGLGGNLMWTAIFREFWNKYGKNNKDLKLLPVEHGKIVRDHLWINNPYITYDPNYKPLMICILEDTTQISRYPNHDVYRDNLHIITSRCKKLGIENPELKCELYFTKNEEEKIANLLKILPNKFICIEPNSKGTYTLNKFYPFNKWQNIRNHFKDYEFVQVGNKVDRVLNNVINLVGKLTFRETALLLKYSTLYIGIEGGLVHCCNAVNCKKAFVIVPPLFHPNLVKYPKYKYIWLGNENHKRCGMRGKCQECYDIINNNNEKYIIDEIEKYI